MAVIAVESVETKQLMLAHSQQLMEDGEAYGWSVVLLLYDAAWLQHLEQGRALWEHHAMKLKLRHPLVWHWMVLPSKALAASPQPRKQPPAAIRNHRKAGAYSGPAKPSAEACAAFNKGSV